MPSWIKNFLAPASNPAPPINTSAKILQTAARPTFATVAADTHSATSEEMPGETALRFTRLIMVTANNNNKFYEMKENAGGTFTVRYGRVGGAGATVEYPVSEWDSKLHEKLRKGYADHTRLFAQGSEGEDFLPISNASVQQLIDDLMARSRQSIFNNYLVGAGEVSRRQVERAQALLDSLSGLLKPGMDVKQFNSDLLELFQVIPRKMKNVREHLVSDAPTSQAEMEAIEKKLAEEQATLDVMRAEVETLEQQKSQTPDRKITLLEALGLQIEEVTDSTLVRHIQQMMGSDKKQFRRAFKVTNLRTQQQFENYVADSKNQRVELFWHGSRSENWLSILKTGLVLRPANAVITGKMFGYGLYFADKFRKSLNYTSLSGSFWASGRENRAWLALYDVHLGNPLKIQRHEGWCSQLTEDGLKKRGAAYDSVFAKGGADLINNEYIVYNQAQCTVRYLVEVSN
jgi:poly [ADP-ribose] polymerase 2/3/4